jgi:hypothetical protein
VTPHRVSVRPVSKSQTITPTTLLAGVTPSLVKLDIEGYEVSVLPDLMPILRGLRCPIYLSWHQDWWPYRVSDLARVAWFQGFHCEAVRGDGWTDWGEMLAVPA